MLDMGAFSKAGATHSPAPALWRGARALPGAFQGKRRTVRRIWPWFIALWSLTAPRCLRDGRSQMWQLPTPTQRVTKGYCLTFELPES